MFSSSKRNNNIYIGKLASTTTEEHLIDYFEKFGYVKEAIILKDRSGKSRRYGFVKNVILLVFLKKICLFYFKRYLCPKVKKQKKLFKIQIQ